MRNNPWSNPKRFKEMKAEAISNLERGVEAFALDMKDMPLRERHAVRTAINRWFRANGWHGACRYDGEAQMMSVCFVRRREPDVE